MYTSEKVYIHSAVLTGFHPLMAKLEGKVGHATEGRKAMTDKISRPNDFIPFRAYSVLLESTARATGQTSLGLDLAEAGESFLLHAGPLYLLALTCPTLLDWLSRISRNLDWYTNGFSIRVLHQEGQPFVTLRQDFAMIGPRGRQEAEATMATLAQLIRRIIGREEGGLRCVRFQHPPPECTDKHQRMFGCKIEFSALFTEIVFPAEWLALSPAPCSPSSRMFVDRFIRQRLQGAERRDQTMSAMVSVLIQSLLGGGDCSAEKIARLLGLHDKKLRRLLADEGTHYSDILDKVRHDWGIRLLTETQISVSKIAVLLDYANLSAFSFAFRRWTGRPPRSYRKEQGDKRPVLRPSHSAPQTGQSLLRSSDTAPVYLNLWPEHLHEPAIKQAKMTGLRAR
ncbi:MAG: AraC family transcriptional regulator ligand-binding domain-containing protein [Rhodobacteraceae bacterium]|nr:AraC family transcriptional regulator ligand-binding domain-containing protein [Paracoccaceae bacterium]